MLDPGRTSFDADADADAVQPSPSEAARFLTALDDGGKFTFQTFDDNAARGNKRLAQIRHGSLNRHWPELVQLNNRGAGIFVTVNETDLEGRKTGNIVRVRALFVDLDGAPLDPVTTHSTPPHIIGESSPGRWHCYWLVCDVPLDQFEPMQKALAARFNGDPSVHDLPRVLRLPGFVHQKAAPFLSILQDVDPRPAYTFEQMRGAFPPAPEPERKPEPEPTGDGITDRRRGEAWAQAALTASASDLANAGAGTRHKTLLAKANRMGTMIARGWIDTNEVRRALFAAAEANGQNKEYGVGKFNDTFKDGIKHGILTPHPDLPNDPAPAATAPGDETGAQAAAPPLPFINMTGWDAVPAPPRPWGVLDRIPLLQPTLFSGEGATGKTLIELQLCVAHVLGRDWLGSMPEPGPAIYLGCEDDADELHRRLAAIAEFYGVKFADLIAGGLHLLSFAGEDAVLAAPDRQGKIMPTPLYGRLLEAAADIKPKHIGIDTSADTFGGNEIDRGQVRQYVGMLRRLAIVSTGSVVLLAHPSLTGISSGTGLSGSTSWHNSVRARMYLRKAADADDGDLRELSFMKNNYGALAGSVVLRFRNGLFLPEGGPSTLEKLARDQKVDESFLDVLGKLIKQNRPVSPSPHAATNYGPKAIAGHPDGKHYTQRDYTAALERLLAANRVHIDSFGPDSKKVRHLALGPSGSGGV